MLVTISEARDLLAIAHFCTTAKQKEPLKDLVVEAEDALDVVSITPIGMEAIKPFYAVNVIEDAGGHEREAEGIL